jgi:hypothetical protein
VIDSAGDEEIHRNIALVRLSLEFGVELLREPHSR